MENIVMILSVKIVIKTAKFKHAQDQTYAQNVIIHTSDTMDNVMRHVLKVDLKIEARHQTSNVYHATKDVRLVPALPETLVLHANLDGISNLLHLCVYNHVRKDM